LKLVAPSSLHTNGSARQASAENAVPEGPLEQALSALTNLGMKPIEAKHAVESVIKADASTAGNLEILIRKSLAVLLGEK
jgi:Holliday junction resolvasome RuvABC DNA-binding subunit